MRTVVSLCAIVAVVVLLENVNAQRSNSYITRQNEYRPSSYSSGGNVIRILAPSGQEIDVVTSEIPQGGVQKVRLDVYYETDCPDSMRFITNQLYPLYQTMEDIVDIRLVPYGKASERYNNVTDRYDFICQHGRSECFGNTVQGCAISLYPEKDYMSFIYCMETYPRPSQNGAKCARRLSLDWDKIEKCAQGEEGNRLMHENAQLTQNLSPSLYFVPWVTFDEVFSRKSHRMSLINLEYVVCGVYKGNHPKCQS